MIRGDEEGGVGWGGEKNRQGVRIVVPGNMTTRRDVTAASAHSDIEAQHRVTTVAVNFSIIHTHQVRTTRCDAAR